ncbi:hypothetical protein [Pseudooceanicola atlanticus]|uniref:hypothetical protein n=1 Tax=Pseudooceanicola atlanticus TaxID=1461694 RepID=UPI002352AE22|nr:hypothetical protein [Pseudooceanicola atlanticus]
MAFGKPFASAQQPDAGPALSPQQPGFLKTMFSRGPGGILPERGSAQQRELVAAALQQAAASAGSSGSPLLAFLTPMLGGAIKARTGSLGDMSKGKSLDSFYDATGMDPNSRGLLDMLEDPNLPDAAKAVVRDRFKDMAKGKTGGSKSSGARRATGAPKDVKRRLYGEYEQDGVVYGRDKFGQLHPYLTPDGSPLTTGGNQVRAPETDLAKPAAMTSGPSMMAPAIPTEQSLPRNDDPLGIRNG